MYLDFFLSSAKDTLSLYAAYFLQPEHPRHSFLFLLFTRHHQHSFFTSLSIAHSQRFPQRHSSTAKSNLHSECQLHLPTVRASGPSTSTTSPLPHRPQQKSSMSTY